MKNPVKSLLILAVAFIAFTSQAQAQEVVKLDQTPGEFEQTELTLKAGTYIFDVTNSGVDHEVGFVITTVNKKGESGDHLKTSYLSKTINDGESARSQAVSLEPGTYHYFCPLNPTPTYTITVTK